MSRIRNIEDVLKIEHTPQLYNYMFDMYEINGRHFKLYTLINIEFK